jgi:hypothetical protein
MSLEAHIGELKKKHATIAEQIEKKENYPSTDTLELKELKRQKLHLKDAITRLSHDNQNGGTLN